MIRFLTFGTVSALGACIDLFLGLTFLSLGFSSWTSLALAMVVSATVVYVLHQKITFGDIYSRQLHRGRLVIFLATSAAIYVVRVVVFEWLRYHQFSEFIALSIALVVSIIFNYASSRVLIFAVPRKKKKY